MIGDNGDGGDNSIIDVDDDDHDNDDDENDDNAGEHAAAGDTARIGRNPGRLPHPPPPQESIRSF